MKTKTISHECLKCEEIFTLNWKGNKQPIFCPFCGEEVVLEDEPEEFEEDDVYEEDEE